MFLWLILTALFFAQPSQEVIARFDAETYAPLTGQPFTLTLIVETPEGVILTDWPVFEGMWGAFEVQSVGEKTESLQSGGGKITQQSFVVILWRPEDAVTPETFISYSLGGEDIRRVPVREAFISVPTVVDPLAPELIPAQPLTVRGVPVWLFAVVIAIATAITFGVFYGRKPKIESLPLSASERAVKALGAIGLDITRSAADRLRDAVAILATYGREVALTDELSALMRSGEEAAYSGKPLTDGQVRGFIGRATALLNGEARTDE